LGLAVTLGERASASWRIYGAGGSARGAGPPLLPAGWPVRAPVAKRRFLPRPVPGCAGVSVVAARLMPSSTCTIVVMPGEAVRRRVRSILDPGDAGASPAFCAGRV